MKTKSQKNNPNNSYLPVANWQELYALTEHWKSDLHFFKDEIQFLHNLIDKFFIWIKDDTNISEMEKVLKHLNSLNKMQKIISLKITKHLRDIELLMENPFSHDETIFREEHVRLEESITTFVLQFRNLKQEVFIITEHIMENEKLHHHLTSYTSGK